MKNDPVRAGVQSALVPGLGQMFPGQSVRGASILSAVIVAGNLNTIWLSTFARPAKMTDSHDFWSSVLPRILHDLFAVYGVMFFSGRS